LAQIGKKITEAKAFLEAGELVAIPTETVYGLAGNGLRAEVATKIFQAKNRPAFDPLILHTNSVEKISKLVQEIPEKAKMLAEAFWPGPLTLLLPKSELVPDLVTSGLETVAVRIPKHPLTLQLLSELDFPVAAPSANPFSYISPTSAQHVQQHLGDKIPYILDGGNCQVGIESTIVGFPNGIPTIYRKGGTSLEQIEAIIGKVAVNSHSSSNPQAPGMLKKHYSPSSKLILGNILELLKLHSNKRIAIISFQKDYWLDFENELGNQKSPTEKSIFILSNSGDFAEAAQNLFSTLRQIDELQPELILAELLPEKGLGVAINDRLKRASAEE
jgi:L-threonylcarbamoyladenylate synthase